MGRKKHRLPFDQKGGVLVLQRRLISSSRYLDLCAQAKVLMLLLHEHWRNEKPVAFGVREAMQKIPCAKGTAQRAFRELEDNGFIVKVDESLFNSRIGSRSRTWRLTWLPFNFREPTNDWEN